MKNLPDCITDMIYDHLDDKDHLSIACTSWRNYWYLWDIIGSWTWDDNYDNFDNFDNFEYFGDDFVIKKPYPKGPKCRYCKNYKYSKPNSIPREVPTSRHSKSRDP